MVCDGLMTSSKGIPKGQDSAILYSKREYYKNYELESSEEDWKRHN